MKLVLTQAQQHFLDQTFASNRAKFGTSVMTAMPPEGGDLITLPPAPVPAPTAVPTDLLTNPDVVAAIEKARQQEKDKLYGRLEEESAARKKLEEQMEAFSADLTTRQQAEEEARRAAEQAAEDKRLAELSFAERLAETESRFTTQLTGLQGQLQQREEILAKEREFTELMQYRAQALQSEVGQQVIPELRDLVAGNTREEIDAAISALAEKSASILDQAAQAMGAQRQQARGVGVTAPPVGPLDNQSGYESVSADDIRGMDMQTYAQNRGRLLGAASQSHRDRGMFG